MKGFFSVVSAVCLFGLTAGAAPVTVCDFESYEVGQTVQMWNFYGGVSAPSVAVVEADPSDPANKVLHVTLKGWNDYVELPLPEGVAKEALGDKYTMISADLRRHDDDPSGGYIHLAVMLGSESLYEDDGWPSYGATGVWSRHTYNLSAPAADNRADKIHIGFNSDKAEYYIDNITLSGKYDDYDTHESGKLDFSDPSSTDANYTDYSRGILIPAGTSLDVYTSRYTSWTSPIAGEGRLNIHGGGERTFIGTSNGKTSPDWSEFSGDVHIYPYQEVNPAVKAGFYGVVLANGGKKFNSDDIRGSIADGNVTSLLADNRVTLHEGATIAAYSDNNARAFRIGELTLEAGSHLNSHFKSSSYRVYYLVGALGTDAVLAGKIAPTGSSVIGLIKEGKGTYVLSGNENKISGGLSVIGGRVSIENDIAAALTGKLAGPASSGSTTAAGVTVYTSGELAGNGHISSLTDIYGHICPGTAATPGTLTLADFAGNAAIDLRLRPSSRAVFRLVSAESHDALDVSGKVTLYNIREDLQTSDVNPVLEISVPEDHQLKAGDTFVLLKASGKSSLSGKSWNFRIQYPTVGTWEVTESEADGFTVSARLVSLDYSGQGDEIIKDGSDGDSGLGEDFTVDYTQDLSDPTPLRALAEKAGKFIGVAVPAYKYAVGDDSDLKTSTITKQFNIVVAENEMKIDATEPSRGQFEFYNADRLVGMASRHSMAVRGHTLVWHQQVPSWISSDGKKNSNNFGREELLGIMNNHIDGVMSHFKGQVREWDVVNECLDDDQSIVRNNPDGYKLRTSVWQLGIGADFIEKAFERAHEADPDAKLFLNDYGVEFIGNAKAEAFYNLAKYLVGKGVPINGVGLQCHLTVGKCDASKLAANIRRYQELGLECIVTELDVAMADPSAADALERQAKEYGSLVKAALSQDNCPTVMIWGLVDPDSWRENNPLIYDSEVRAKRAYYAVHAALRELAEENTGIGSIIASEAEVIREEFYNLQGMRVDPSASGVLIRRSILSDGTVRTAKELH